MSQDLGSRIYRGFDPVEPFLNPAVPQCLNNRHEAKCEARELETGKLEIDKLEIDRDEFRTDVEHYYSGL
jgi:hypothetical protein